MELQRYREELLKGARPALVVNEGRKWMQVLVVDHGKLRMVRRALTEKQHMTPLVTNERKAKASFRRMAKQRGTPRKVREFLQEALA
jgi:hypothetical protein